MNRRIYWMMTIFLVTVLMAAGCQTAKKPEPAPKSPTAKQTNAATTILGAAGKDPYTNGCVSCHKKEGDVDRSLPAYVQKISGHPEVKETTVNACYVCHDSKKNFGLYKRFLRGLHKVHWGSETFYNKLKGQCYSCHTVETNGVSGIKNYPPAGYREEVSNSNAAGTGNVKAKDTPAEKKATQETEKSGSANQSNEQNKTPGGTNNNKTDEVPTPTP